MKITGLDELMKQLDQIMKSLDELDGNIRSVPFEPDNPTSIEVAIKTMENMIDERCANYQNNPIVGKIVQELKETCRKEILNKAAAARIKGET